MFDVSNIATSTTRTITMPNTNVTLQDIGTSSSPTFASTTLKTSLHLEDPGVGTFANIIQSGVLTSDLTYTLPTSQPIGNNGILQSSSAGVLSWNENVVFKDQPWAATKQYASSDWHLIAGDDSPLIKPTVSVTFATASDNVFYADVTLVCVDCVSDEKVAVLRFTAVGGKKAGASGTNIVVGNIESTGDLNAAWSTSVTTTPSKVTMQKSSNLAQGSYSVKLRVKCMGGSVVSFVDESGPTTLQSFNY